MRQRVARTLSTTVVLWRGVGVLALALGTLIACGSDDGDDANNGGGGGGGGKGGSGGAGGSLNLGGSGGSSASGGGGSGGGAADAGVGCGQVVGVVRDFRSSHPDFECTKDNPIKFVDPSNKDCGPWDPVIVGPLGSAIGPKSKPVYAGGSKTPSTTGVKNFDQWFNDVSGVNSSKQVVFQLVSTGKGSFVYETDFFFPIDGQLFDAESGNPDSNRFPSDDGKKRNFHFTYELHTTFRYKAGSTFLFRGDDDVFVYINGKLAVNIGGIHVPMEGKIDLDKGRVEITSPMGFPTLSVDSGLGFTESIAGGVAGNVSLGLSAGEIYAMDFFFAERNCCASNFRLETNFEFVDCGIVK
jgi:fibro-slime domain-containing protein